jgi:Pyruvate/2-oxoacid:ferredoxin oxidoreductase gamma subunit
LNFERRASFSSSEIVFQLELNSIEGDSIPEEEHQETLGFHSKGIKIAGFGGQGILSLGLILATAGMKESYHVSWLPSYGPEIRGGTANCNVVLSRKEIGTPLVDSPDILIAMNGPSLVRFQDRLKVGGLVLYDSSLIPEAPRIRMAEAIGVPASRMAHELGESKAANLIMAGALMCKLPILRTPSIHRAIDEIISSVKMRELNKKALELGMQYHENSNWAK